MKLMYNKKGGIFGALFGLLAGLIVGVILANIIGGYLVGTIGQNANLILRFIIIIVTTIGAFMGFKKLIPF